MWESGGIRELAKRHINRPVIYPADGRFHTSLEWAGYPSKLPECYLFCQSLSNSWLRYNGWCFDTERRLVSTKVVVAALLAGFRKMCPWFELPGICLRMPGVRQQSIGGRDRSSPRTCNYARCVDGQSWGNVLALAERRTSKIAITAWF